MLQTSRVKVPFGIAQIGRSFRNEITPGNFIFRTREFEQMEMEFFVEPGTDAEWLSTGSSTRWNWYTDLGMNPENLRFYSTRRTSSPLLQRTVDVEYTSRSRLVGARGYRQPHRLSTFKQHATSSGENLTLLRPGNRQSYVRTSSSRRRGRTYHASLFLVDCLRRGGGARRDAHGPETAPAPGPHEGRRFPLTKIRAVASVARRLYDDLKATTASSMTTSGAIAAATAARNEAGTPFCITVNSIPWDDNRSPSATG